jgi:hypothetical protein
MKVILLADQLCYFLYLLCIFDVSILNKLMNNMILTLDVYSLLAGSMILCVGNSSRIITIELHEVYNARNNIKLINELLYPDSHFAYLTSHHIRSLHSRFSRTVLFETFSTDSSIIEHVHVPCLRL